MRAFPSDRLAVRTAAMLSRALVLGTAVAAAASPLRGQVTAEAPRAQRTGDVSVVSKTVTFATEAAGLVVETSSGERVDVRFAEGVVYIDGTEVGTYERGGALEDSWRTLMARAVQLDDGSLSKALVEWAPPEELSGDGARVGRALDMALDSILGAAVPVVAPDAANTVDAPTLTGLLSRLDVLGSLGELIGSTDTGRLRVIVGDDFEVGPDEVVTDPVLVVDGDVEIRGTIRGDLLVADGDIEVLEGGVVEGDLRYADGFVDLEGGEVLGRIVEIDAIGVVSTEELRDLGDRIRADIEAEVGAAPRAPRRGPGVLSRIGNVISEIFGTILTIFVFGILGVMVNFFLGENVDRVADVARRNPSRAVAVGFASGFLSLPIYIIGLVLLAVSLIGIPALVVWAPGFPLLVGLAAVLGYVAVARNVGTWLTRQDIPGFEWVSVTRPNSLVFGGLFVLFAPYLLGHVLELGGGWLGGLQDVVMFAGFMLGLVATAAGFGAVLITRGGRRSDYESDDWYADLQDLGSELGDLRGFASDFGRRWSSRDDEAPHPATAESGAADAAESGTNSGDAHADETPSGDTHPDDAHRDVTHDDEKEGG
jgi:hypothetical protein